jgi:hypothetical protein
MGHDYYYALLRQIPRLLVDAIGRVTGIAFLVACGLAAFASSKAAEPVIAPGWWSLVAVAVILLVAFVRANHVYVAALRRKAAGRSDHGGVHHHFYYGSVTQHYIGGIDTREVPITGTGATERIHVETVTIDPQDKLPLDG